MSTEFFNDQWRIPSNENQNKISNYSMSFDGTNQSINLGTDFPYPSTVTDKWSFSCWVKLNSTSSGGYIFSTYNGTSGIIVSIRKNADVGKIQGTIAGDTALSYSAVKTNNQLSLNEWKHVVVTYNGDASNPFTAFSIYVNSINNSYTPFGTNSQSGSLINSSNKYIGQFTGGNYLTDCDLDQVTFFDYELSTSEVSTLYGGGTAVTNPMTLSPKPIYYAQLGDQSVDNGANLLVPNNSLSDYVFNFDGTDDFIDCGDSNDFSFGNGSTDSPFSISAWINMDSNASFRIVNKYDAPNYEYQFDTGTSGELRFFVLDGTGYRGRTGSTLNTGQWYHVVATYSGVGGSAAQNGTKIYVNGANVVGSTSTFGSYTAMSNTTAPVFIGRIGTSYSNGKISNTAIFNTELSSTQVETLYNNGAPGDISSLSPVSWYKLNAADTFDGSNWTIKDYGSGNNDGTSSSMDSSNLVVSDLQQTSGYSPYALSLDGVNDFLDCGTTTDYDNGDLSASIWFNASSSRTGTVYAFSNSGSPSFAGFDFVINTSNQIRIRRSTMTKSNETSFLTTGFASDTWQHLAFTYNESTNTIKVFLNAVLQDTSIGFTQTNTASKKLTIGSYKGTGNFFNGELSNAVIWNTELSSTQVTEIYNQGRPSDLNTFSGTAPVAWWQLGSNSSYNSGAWTCLDEIGTNNAVSAGSMTNDDIVDGVGYSASGLGTSSIDIKGDAPYSTANGLSENMDVLDRTTDVAPS